MTETRHELITTVTISTSEYKELLKNTERIAAVKRMLNELNFVNTEDIRVVLGIADIRKEDE